MVEEKNVTKEDLWSVELGHGMGPFVLGLTRIQVVQILRELKLDTEEVQDSGRNHNDCSRKLAKLLTRQNHYSHHAS